MPAYVLTPLDSVDDCRQSLEPAQTTAFGYDLIEGGGLAWWRPACVSEGMLMNTMEAFQKLCRKIITQLVSL